MITSLTKKDLIFFEEDIAASFNEKFIHAPIHLYSGNEDEMLKVFQDIKPKDWILCSWRSHYQCLLKGVPPSVVKKEILKGKSISLSFPKYNIFSSAIVGGVLPIAVGIAFDIKRRAGKNKVYCFVGDMTSETGIMHECFKYSFRNHLPIKFIIEDNNKSVCTDTRKTWNTSDLFFENEYKRLGPDNPYIYYYKYVSKWPHAGSGVRIQF